MRIVKIIMTVFIIGLILAGAIGCKSAAAATTTASKQVKVSAGSISNAVTGTATLGLAQIQNMTFEMAGVVDQILVSVSATVTKSQTLATLDTTVWETNIKNAKTALSNAQRALADKQFALTKAQRLDNSTLTNAQFNLTKANRAIETRQLAKKQADLSLLAAQNTLANVSAVSDAQAAVDSIKANIAYAQSAINGADALRDPVLRSQWTDQLKYLNSQLDAANAKLASVLIGSGVSSTNVSIQIQQDVLAVQQAQKAVSDAQTAIDDAQVDIANAQLAVKNAQTAIDDAQVTINNAQLDVNTAQANVAESQSKLDDLNALSPVITAPFDGFITSIKVFGGDEVSKGTVAMQVADPNQFNATFLVSETDIFSVKVGQSATVAVDALDGQLFPAKVTAIAPLATTSAGVVNYQVTAEITSLIPISNKISFTSGSFTAGGLTGAVSPDNQAQKTVVPQADTAGNQTGQVTGTAATLKHGLSSTVTITIQEKSNVLIVPLRAVTTLAGKSTVQVVEVVTTKTVEVTTGLSDASNIEITGGLTEGQIVLVKASGTSSNSMFGPGGGVMMVESVPMEGK